MQKKLLRIFILISILCLPVVSLAESSEENLIYNGDFCIVSDDAKLPAGWDINAYDLSQDALEYDTVESETGNYLYLNNLSSNDSRFVQNVSVEPNTVYKLSCLISTEDVSGILGATLSVDNYSIDKTYCYSDSISGTNDWDLVNLYVKSGKEQNTFKVALRLGGYSMESSGTACFSEVSLEECKEIPEGIHVIDIEKDTGLTNVQTSSVKNTRENSSNGLLACVIAGILITVLFAVAYFRYLRFEIKGEISKDSQHVILIVVFAFAFVIRMVLSAVFRGHSTDINCFMAWGNAAFNSIGTFYTSGMFADYPPGYMYMLALITGICRILNLGYGSVFYVMLFKLPATIADIVTAYLLYKLAVSNGVSAKKSLIIAGLYSMNPVAMFISGAWGQIDSILALGLVLVLYLVINKKEIIAGIVYGLTILLKPQALMLGPMIALSYFVKNDEEKFAKRILKALISVASALLVIFLVSLPFKGTQNFGWLIDKYIATSGSYNYASIEAFNFFSVFNGNWAPADNMFLGLSYKTYGTIFICISCLISFYLYLKSYKKHKGSLYLCSAFMLTMIFTFGHYMHERYLFPVLVLILVAYIYEKDKRLFFSFLSISAVLLFNTVCAMYIVDHQNERTELYRAMTVIGSVAETCAAVYFGIVSFRILVLNKTILCDAKPEKPEKSNITKKVFLPDESNKRNVKYGKKEIFILVCFTLIYGVISLLNLGTTKSPQTYWQTDSLGEEITVSFDKREHIQKYWVFCNIGNASVNNSGTLLIKDDNGTEELYEQTYDNMFRWQTFDTDFDTKELTISLYSGSVKINEIAFFDENGKLVHATVQNPAGTQSNILDEQDTVPDAPSYFNGMYFDELYHARTAYEHLHNLKPYENSHPPLGKIFIMLGIAVFGMCPFGWRVVGALFGIMMIPILYCFGKRFFRKESFAWLFTVLFAFDFMHFTQTRIATIDVYGVFFIILMFYYMYRYISMNFYTDGLRKTLKPLAVSGIFFGIGISCKWICFYAGAGLAVLFFMSLFDRFREYRTCLKTGSEDEIKSVKCFRRNVIVTLLWCVLFFIVIPFLFYFMSYIPYYIYEKSVNTEYELKEMINTFARYQEFMFSYHSGLKATHPYQSSWYEWPFTVRPMWYYSGRPANGYLSTISASGNPAVWWIGTIGTVTLFILWLFNRIKKDKRLKLICVGVLANFLPWVLVKRCTFIYHFFATVPFILLGAVYLLKWIEQRHPRYYWIKYVWAALCILLFVCLYPGLSGLPITQTLAKIIKLLPGGSLMYGA